MITSLTKEQEAKFPTYIKKWIDIGLNTQPIDLDKAKFYARKCYKIVNLKPPTVFFVTDCPLSCAYLAVRIKERVEKLKKQLLLTDESHIRAIKEIQKEIKDGVPFDITTIHDHKVKIQTAINEQAFGGMEAGWLSFYDFFIRECKVKIDQINGLMGLSGYCGWWAPYSECVIFQHRPEEIHLEPFTDAQGNELKRLHNPNGAAVKFRGAGLSNVYSIHGMRVTKNIVERNYTWRDIDTENNAEVRRIMVELYGQAKYLQESNAEVLHSDDFGTIYRKEQLNDEPIHMVKVINSTQERDGSFKEYFLEFNPETVKKFYGKVTARGAVASTWRYKDGSPVFKKAEDYVCQIES